MCNDNFEIFEMLSLFEMWEAGDFFVGVGRGVVVFISFVGGVVVCYFFVVSEIVWIGNNYRLL